MNKNKSFRSFDVIVTKIHVVASEMVEIVKTLFYMELFWLSANGLFFCFDNMFLMI